MTNQPEQPGNASIPEECRGSILQRGGEELLLEKVEDRFTVNAHSKEQVQELARRIPAEVNPGAAPPRLTEFRVDPAQADQVMQQVRASEEVNYASHVYQIKDNPASQIYLTNQLTVVPFGKG
jgi:hypothetical protein